jgi:hypothetical protein
MTEGDFLHEEPPAYGAVSEPSFVLKDCSRLKRTPLKLNWNKLHIQSRQEICLGACVSEKMARKSWEELDRWLQALLEYSTELRSKGKIQLCG